MSISAYITNIMQANFQRYKSHISNCFACFDTVTYIPTYWEDLKKLRYWWGQGCLFVRGPEFLGVGWRGPCFHWGRREQILSIRSERGSEFNNAFGIFAAFFCVEGVFDTNRGAEFCNFAIASGVSFFYQLQNQVFNFSVNEAVNEVNWSWPDYDTTQHWVYIA